MKENIEEDIKIIENLIECFRKAEIVNLEYKESIYQRCNYSHYKAIEHILSDYKRVLKENEELKEQNRYEWIRQHCLPQNLINKYYIPKQKIKDKIKELEKFTYTGENAPQDFLQYRVKTKIQGYKELLEEK